MLKRFPCRSHIKFTSAFIYYAEYIWHPLLLRSVVPLCILQKWMPASAEGKIKEENRLPNIC